MMPTNSFHTGTKRSEALATRVAMRGRHQLEKQSKFRVVAEASEYERQTE